MLRDKTCQTCGCSFKGGPRAWYCPDCRAERQKASWREHQRRKRQGLVRKLGSIDQCERCGKSYTVEGGLQRFCPDCQPINAQEHDQKASLEYYHVNKEKINPVRNERRRLGKRICVWCEKEYRSNTSSYTCSDECHRNLINKEWNERYNLRKKNKKKPKSIKGQRFGMLVALKEAARRSNVRRWLCRCDCGNEKIVYMNTLGKATTSCGCIYQKRTCDVCGVEFEGKTNAKTCSGCKAEKLRRNSNQSYNRKINNTSKVIGGKYPCSNCGEMFILKTGIQLYCDKCQEDADKKRMRDRYHRITNKQNNV